jgi:hypothetical protein
MPKSKERQKQNLTIQLDRATIQKIKVIAAEEETSIGGLVVKQLEEVVGRKEAYRQAKRQALALMDDGFHLGGVIRATRDEWHER